MTITIWLNFSSGKNPDLAYQWVTKRKLISLAELCALPSALLVYTCIWQGGADTNLPLNCPVWFDSHPNVCACRIKNSCPHEDHRRFVSAVLLWWRMNARNVRFSALPPAVSIASLTSCRFHPCFINLDGCFAHWVFNHNWLILQMDIVLGLCLIARVGGRWRLFGVFHE